jgi:hypothetical protein
MPNIALIINLWAVVACLFALWKGGAAERIAAVAVIANILIGQSGEWLDPGFSDQVRLVNDGLAAVILLGVTVRYGTLWMGGVMLFYAAQFSLHSYYLVTDRPDSDYLHALINNLNFAGVTWCLIIGTAVAWRRRVRMAAAEGPAA